MTDTAIEVKELSKVFKLYPNAMSIFKEFAFGGQRHEEKIGLDNISFTVNKGDVMGVAGPNGAGKSTLLKIISGVMPPTSGSVTVNGKVTSILELGTGFRPDYTGRQNVLMGGLYLGYKKQEIQDRMDWITKFSELEDSIDWPFGTYSSGMKARLMFALAISANPDILIVDEALAVGDSAFATKCFQRINEICLYGATVFFVTHQMAYITRSCNRAMFIDEGQVKLIADPNSVSQMYEKLMIARSPETSIEPFDFEGHRRDDGVATLWDIKVKGVDGDDILTVGSKLTIEAHVECKEPINDTFSFLQIVDAVSGGMVISLHNQHSLNLEYKESKTAIDLKKGRNIITIEMPYVNISRGKYAVNFGFSRASDSYSYDDMMIYARNCATFNVVRHDLWQNVSVELPSEWSVDNG